VVVAPTPAECDQRQTPCPRISNIKRDALPDPAGRGGLRFFQRHLVSGPPAFQQQRQPRLFPTRSLGCERDGKSVTGCYGSSTGGNINHNGNRRMTARPRLRILPSVFRAPFGKGTRNDLSMQESAGEDPADYEGRNT